MTDTRAIEAETAHRPWPLPRGPWVLFQSWHNLLFAHWRLPADQLRSLVPAPLELDLHEDDAWVGITPFEIRDFRVRGLPAVPKLSDFPELNLRTYVRSAGKPGIYFFSLDAGSRLATLGARVGFRLPYRTATMSVEEEQEEEEAAAAGSEAAAGRFRYRSEREGGVARFRAVYGPVGPVFKAEPGTLEHFLTERYVLFTVLRSGAVLEAEIHHRPWPLQPAEGSVEGSQLAAAEGVSLPDEAPLLHFSHRQETLIWPPVRQPGGPAGG